jgi:hypothetical protein
MKNMTVFMRGENGTTTIFMNGCFLVVEDAEKRLKQGYLKIPPKIGSLTSGEIINQQRTVTSSSARKSCATKIHSTKPAYGTKDYIRRKLVLAKRRGLGSGQQKVPRREHAGLTQAGGRRQNHQ